MFQKERLKFINKSTDNGWCTLWTWYEDGEYKTWNTVTDKSWSQGMYGITLANYYDFLQHEIVSFIDGTIDMLTKTNGIFIRDNNKYSINKYMSSPSKNSKDESSKDQLLGLITGLVAIYESKYYKQLSPLYKQRLIGILRYIDYHLQKKWYKLYNEHEKRYYDSAYYVYVHYKGIHKALDKVLNGKGEDKRKDLSSNKYLPLILRTPKYRKNILMKGLYKVLFDWLCFYELKNAMDIYEGKLKYQKWFNFPPKKQYYNINLRFYELYLLVVTDPNKYASIVLELLEKKSVCNQAHKNLASLYFFILNNYNEVAFKGLRLNYNEDVYMKYDEILQRDDILYRYDTLPNEITFRDFDKLNPYSHEPEWLQITYCECRDNLKTMEDIIRDNKNFKFDNGLCNMMRSLLSR